jgi:spermidine synthase
MQTAVEPSSPGQNRPVEALTLYACFFISGVAGLIYEVLWARYLALFIGSTAMAQVIVLATFMGGLAAGSYVFGRLVDRMDAPLKLYVYLEFGVGLYALLLFDPIHQAGRSVFFAMARGAEVEAGGLVAGKLAASVLTLLLPTFLMGGTFPALGRHMVRTLAAVGPKISRLYFLNSLGAVGGCLAAGFFLIRAAGLDFTMTIAAALNILSGLGAMIVSARGADARASGAPTQDATPSPDATTATDRVPGVAFWTLLICVGLSGAVSMAYEVAWIRLLTLVLGSSTYSFSLMLATFILGLSLGGLFLSLRKRTEGYGRIFGWCEIAVGLTVLLSLPFYVRLPFLFNQIASFLSREPETFPLYQLCKFLLCALVMIVPTILQGVTFPAATRALIDNVGSLGRRVGLVLAVNTVGAVGGTIYAGFYGLPGLGIKGLLELAVALNGILGLAILLAVRPPKGSWRPLLGALAATAAVWLWHSSQMGEWNKGVMTSGVYRIRNRVNSYEELLERVAKQPLLFYRDGIDATIAVVQDEDDRGQPEKLLVINGKVDASTSGDLPTQKLLGHLPMLLHPDPKNILVIGLGSGATVGAIMAHQGVERIDFVEISGDVVEASRHFAAVNGEYWSDPRVHPHVEDAKTFLQTTARQYDLIINEPTNPWIAGVAGLFTREYYEICLDRLAPGGLYTQWQQSYELEDLYFLMMLETFTGVFPCYTQWNPVETDTIQIGSLQPYAPDFDRMRRRIEEPAVKEDLEMFGISSFLSILATQMANRADAPFHVSWTNTEHSDAFPLLDYVAPRGFFVGSNAEAARYLDERPKAPANSRLWVIDYLRAHQPTAEEFKACYESLYWRDAFFAKYRAAWAREWRARYPNDPEAQIAVALTQEPSNADAVRDLSRGNIPEEALTFDTERARCLRRIKDYTDQRSCLGFRGAEEALADVETLAATYPEQAGSDAYTSYWRGLLLHDLGRNRPAVDSLREAAEGLANYPDGREVATDAALTLCEAFLSLNDLPGAQEAYEAFLEPVAFRLPVRQMKARLQARASNQSPSGTDAPKAARRPGQQ